MENVKKNQEQGKYRLISFAERTEENLVRETFIDTVISHGRLESEIKSKGNGPVDAFITGLRRYLGITTEVITYEEHSLRSGADAKVIAHIGLKYGDQEFFGSGIDANISLAAIKAILSALNQEAMAKEGE